MRDILIYSRVPSELPPLVAKVKPDQIASYHVKFENEQPTQVRAGYILTPVLDPWVHA